MVNILVVRTMPDRLLYDRLYRNLDTRK